MRTLLKRGKGLAARILRPAGPAVRRFARAFATGWQATRRRLGPLVEPLARRVHDAAALLARRLSAAATRAARAVSAGARAAWSAFARAVYAAAEAVRPADAAALLCAAGAASLAVAQFTDYRAIEVVTVELSRKSAGSAHAYLLLPVALAALLASAAAFRGRIGAGRLVAVLGLLSLGVTLLVDLPSALDEGSFARNYQGARATVAEGFWLELAASTTLVAGGALLGRFADTGFPAPQIPGQAAVAGNSP